ncbi:MAG: DedA family protein [Kofleriaceae bacterium]|nr:DedA family protein [Myxococcales bacterium]MCB9561740.1 DedA family protein [Kofleriaceae bacterium]MCB9573711.1 DedA family protein [Kofleriaceae bacterium]
MDAIAHHLQDLIRDLGYTGLFVLIVLESTAVPVPSLLVMPFAGFLASQGHFSLPAILAVNAAGALVGSGLSYWFGAAGGKPLLLRYGKYILVRPEDIQKTHDFFEKYGARTIFVARFLPVLRHIISIPAGIARMRLPTFFGLTLAGASIWGGGLMVLGYELGANWEHVVMTWKKVDVFVGAMTVLLLVVFAVRFVRKRRSRAAATPEHTPAPESDA